MQSHTISEWDDFHTMIETSHFPISNQLLLSWGFCGVEFFLRYQLKHHKNITGLDCCFVLVSESSEAFTKNPVRG